VNKRLDVDLGFVFHARLYPELDMLYILNERFSILLQTQKERRKEKQTSHTY
jgi:hypothetical protein